MKTFAIIRPFVLSAKFNYALMKNDRAKAEEIKAEAKKNFPSK